MLLCTAALAVLALLKFLAVANAIRWIYVHGPSYRAEVTRRPPASSTELDDLYARLGGAFVPFGVKDYRLRRWSERLAARGHRATAFAVTLLRLLFSLPVLVGIVAAYTVATVSLPGLPDLGLGTVNDALLLLTLLALVIATMMLAGEAVVAYAVLGSYGIAFHAATTSQRGRHWAMIQEFRVFVGAAVFAHLASAATMYLVNVRFGGYGRLRAPTDGLSTIPIQALDSYYYAFMVFVGAGDPEPLAPVGQIATGLTAAQGLALLLLVLATMLTVLGEARARPADPHTADTAASAAAQRPPDAAPETPTRGDAPQRPTSGNARRRASARRGRVVAGVAVTGGVLGAVGSAAAVAWLLRRRRSRGSNRSKRTRRTG